jgi:hypothetical protein
MSMDDTDTRECELASCPQSAVDVSPPKQTEVSHCDLNPNDSLVVVTVSLTSTALWKQIRALV